MTALRLQQYQGEAPVPVLVSSNQASDRRASNRQASNKRLAGLSHLASVDIETPLVANLSGELHALFDHVSEDTLPIYFGPLLGRLYLEGL